MFEKGRLRSVCSLGFVDTSYPYPPEAGEIQIPPDAFVRLLLGFRDLNELADAWPDIRIKPGFGLLLDVLFPRMDSYLTLPRTYRGPLPKKAFNHRKEGE